MSKGTLLFAVIEIVMDGGGGLQLLLEQREHLGSENNPNVQKCV